MVEDNRFIISGEVIFIRYLKWDNTIIGIIDNKNSVSFIQPKYNDVVSLYTNDQEKWSLDRFTEFLSERMISKDRKDIEKILFRLRLSHYDVFDIAEITRGINAKDLLWIAYDEDEKSEDIMTDVFKSVFHQHVDLVGDSIDTPEGYNIKRYGVYRGQYGIYKQRINPLVTDVESDVAVYLLAKELGVPCCPAYRTDKNTVFSAFMYDFSKDYIVHYKNIIK